MIGRVLVSIFLLYWLVPAAVATMQPTVSQAAAAHDEKTAVAVATIHVSPTMVAAGETVTLTGTGFLAAEPVELQLVAPGANAPSDTYTLKTVTADRAGHLAQVKIAIPDIVPSGSYQIRAMGLSPKMTVMAKAPLQVQAAKPTVTVAPTSFAPNDEVKVSGTHFGKNETVTFSLSTTSGSAAVPIGQTQASASGAFSAVTLHVQFGVPAGTLLLIASGTTSNLQALRPVRVNSAMPTITLSSGAALPGASITVTGARFQPGETVTVDLVTLSTSTMLGTARANQAGRFTHATTIPANTPEGTVSIVASGDTSRLSATAPLKMGARPARLVLSTNTLKAGDTVRISATGFIPGETVSIVLSGGKISPLTLTTAVVGTAGSFSIAGVRIPASILAGSYRLAAAGQVSGRSATGALTVQTPAHAAPIVSIIGVTAASGQPYVVSPAGFMQVVGSNFGPGARITLVLVGAKGTVSLAVITASSAGTFGPLGLTIPAVTMVGSYTLQAQVHGASAASLPVQVVMRTPHIAVSTGTLVAGRAVTVTGGGFAPGEQVTLALDGAALLTTPSTVLANTTGAFTASFVVPETLTNGANTLTASGISSRAVAMATLQASLSVASRWYFANGDTTGSNRTVITMLNPASSPAHVSMTFLYAVGVAGHYSQVVPAHSVASMDLALAAGSGRRISTILSADQKISATSTITYGSADSASTAGARGPSKLWYLAEGYDNGSFSEEVVIMNPNKSVATIDVRFLPFNNHPAQETRFVMQPRSNISINAAQYIAKQSFAVVVTADQNVVVERSMRFGAGGRGADDKVGINSASTVWDFAYGESAPDRQTFFTILNPNQASPAAVTATFFDRTGKPVGTQTIVIDPLHRGNIKLNDVLAQAIVATVMTSNVPVVVERPVYQSSPNLSTAPSGGVAFGSNGSALAFAFPDLSTAGGDNARLYLFNPGVKQVTVRATFYTATGGTAAQDLVLPANGDIALNVNSVPGLSPGPLGARLTSTNGQAFVAEQTMLNRSAQRFDSMEGIVQ
jgi:hypothetical protein